MATYTLYFRGTTNDAWGYPEAMSVIGDSTIQLPTHTPARTGYDFGWWDTMQDGSGSQYDPGDWFTMPNSDEFLYAHWYNKIYHITYDANGGIGAPSIDTHLSFSETNISSDIPTRKNHIFKGWGVSSTSTTVAYEPGDVYSANSDIVLYAIWELSYENPSITNMVLYRSNSSGTSSDTGTYFHISFNWSTYKALSSIIVEWKTSSATTWSSSTISASGTSGNVNVTLGGGNISTDSNYSVKITVSDSNGSTTVTGRVPGKSYTVDFMPGGSGVAFGKNAEQTDLFEVDWNVKFNGNLTVSGTSTLPDIEERLEALESGGSGSSSPLDAWPVNSVYIGYSHTSPASLFGGTWAEIDWCGIWIGNEWSTIGSYKVFNMDSYVEDSGANNNFVILRAWRRTA